MVAKTILYDEEARKALEQGMDTLAEAVSITLGPKGRNVVLGKKFGTPQIVNDGVTIAKEINLQDNLENTGVCLIRQAASKTNDVAGDGTTTATVLAYAIIKEGMRNVAAGANPIVLKRGIEKATQFVVSKIIDYARPIENLSDITKVATISAGNDTEGLKYGVIETKEKYHLTWKWLKYFKNDRDCRDLITCGAAAGVAAATRS